MRSITRHRPDCTLQITDGRPRAYVRVMAGENFSDVIVNVVRAGAPNQHWVHSIRSLVITDDAHEPDYLVLIIKDDTERFEAEERFESAFNANPAPAVICRVSDLHYVKVNQGFLEMTGYDRDDVIGCSFHRIDVLTDVEKRDLALERLKEGRTIPQMEACLPLPGGGLKFVIVAGEPIEIAEESCVLFTFADLDPRRKAETALRQSEERFAKSFRLSPVAAAICTLDGFKLIEVNEAFKTMTGYAEEEVVGRNATDLRLLSDKGAQRDSNKRSKTPEVSWPIPRGSADASWRNWPLCVRHRDLMRSAPTLRI